jgi:hypothetical protein
MKSLITLVLSLLVSTSAFSYTQKCEETIRASIIYYKSKMQGVTDKGFVHIKYTHGRFDLIAEFNLVGLEFRNARLALDEDNQAPALLIEKLDDNGYLKGINVLSFNDWNSFVFVVEPMVAEACEGQYELGDAADGSVTNMKLYYNNKKDALAVEELRFIIPYVYELETTGFEDNTKRDNNLKTELPENSNTTERSNSNFITIE